MFRTLAIVALAALSLPGAAWAQAASDANGRYQNPTDTQPAGNASAMDGLPPGPVRLRPGVPATGSRMGSPDYPAQGMLPPEPYKPGEFELFVRKLQNEPDESRAVRRLGSELALTAGEPRDSTSQVPADYLVAPGDELQLTIWGSVDADLTLVVDRGGRVTVPRVGAVPVAGVRAGELQPLFEQRTGRVFKNFQLSVTVSRVRDIRIYVTGFAVKPGAYTVGGLATLAGGLMRAGGPAAAGSFRNIELRRKGQTVSKFDLYDLLLRGDRSADVPLQANDVLHIGPVGRQVALIGSVNRPGIFELKDGDSIETVLAMAGGFAPVADRTRLAVERLDARSDVRIVSLALPAALKSPLSDGDVMRAFSVVDAALPVARQNKRVRVEGEVNNPGDYIVPASTSLPEVLRAAGGTTGSAFIFGTEFHRESVRRTQQENYDRALRDLETQFNRTMANQRSLNAEESQAQAYTAGTTTRLIERMRQIRPTGRIVLQLERNATELPPLTLEDGDRIYIPPRPTSVGVFGSVFNSGSYLYIGGRSIKDYLDLAGGMTRNADADSSFVIRANGNVLSSRQEAGWFGGRSIDSLPVEAGDTIFVPEEIGKITFMQGAKEWTQILYQFGLGAAALKTIRGN